MQANLPPTSADSHIFSLLSILEDPKSAKTRLTEISKATAEYEAVVKKNSELARQAEIDRKAAEQLHKDLEGKKKEHEETVHQHMAEIEKVKSDLTTKTKQLEDLTEYHIKQRNDLRKGWEEFDLKVHDLNNQVNQANLRDVALTKREELLKKAEEDHSFKVKQLMDILG